MLENDPEVFKKSSKEELGVNKYILYELIDLYSSTLALEKTYVGIAAGPLDEYKKRMTWLFSNTPCALLGNQDIATETNSTPKSLSHT